MGAKENQEFKNAIRDIGLNIHKLVNSFDRVRVAEWVRKLTELSDDNLETSHIRNEYAQLLRVQVFNHVLHDPFLSNPPCQVDTLVSLPEFVGNLMAKQIPDLPRAGPIAPVIHHRSPDGCAYITVKQIPGNGVLCYLAVSPDGLM